MNDSILNDLMLANDHHRLVNVYQIGSEIFYTGYIYKLNSRATVLKVYDNYGMCNGLVYLKIAIIDQVDFISDDLLHMQTKIETTRELGFKVPVSADMNLPKETSLLYQIVGRTYVEDQILVISLYNQSEYVEGFVDHFDQNGLVLSVVNEFDFAYHQNITISYNNIRLVELLGKELTMLQQSKKLLFGRHQKIIRYKRSDAVKKHLINAASKKILVLVMPKADDGLFFVGKVNAWDANSVILNVIDMAGQFGGYVLMKLSNIDFIEIQSDYLKIMAHFLQLNQKKHMWLQSVLNPDRVFVPGDNWIISILNQASILHRIIRIQFRNGTDCLGYPLRLCDNHYVDFRKLDPRHEHLQSVKKINLSQVVQISFDYLGTFYIQARLKRNYEL